MPKRKYVYKEDYDKLCKKLKQIEKEVLLKKSRRSRARVLSSSSSDDDDSFARRSQRDDRPPSNASSADPGRESSLFPLRDDSAAGPAAASLPAAVPALPPAFTDHPTAAVSASTPVISNLPADEVILGTPDDATPELDADILEILGIDPTKTEKFGKGIQRDVAVRFEHTATAGLSKEDRKNIMTKYLIPENCKLIGAPALNPEIRAALSESVIKRDVVIETKQKLMASAISSLGEAISVIMASKEKNTQLLRFLMDTAKTLCDCQHHETNIRRNFIIFSVKKDMKESLQNTKIDSFLFGHNLAESLKTAKAINKQGAELKPSSTPKPVKRVNLPSTSKNWKSQGRANRTRPQGTTSKTPTLKSTLPKVSRDPRASSYKRSQPHRGSHNRP